MEMASRGDHQGPRVRCVPALLLLGHGAHTRGYTTKSKDLGKAARAARKHRAKSQWAGWKEPKRAKANKAGQGENTSPPATHQHPAYSARIVNRGRQHVRTRHQHPPKPARFSKNIFLVATCPFCSWQGPQLSPGCLAQGTTEKDGSPFQRRVTKGWAMPRMPSPLPRAGSPSLLQ